MEQVTTEHEQETTDERSSVLKVPTTLKSLIEGLIFAAQEPLTLQQMRTVYQGEGRGADQRQLDGDDVRRIIDALNRSYRDQDRPYRIVQVAGGYQFATLPEYAEWVGKLYREQGRRKLSQSGIESLAIIAYKQPITKAEIEKIRGVNCDYVLKTLLEKELVTVTGRAETVGRPLLYGTTRDFLKHFGLNDITDLPRPREIEEILGENQFETERRMLEAQAGAEAMRKEAEEFKSRLPHIPKKKPELERPVEIVHRKRTRDIRLVSGEAKKDLEAAGQEPMPFAETPTATELPPPVAPIADDSTVITAESKLEQRIITEPAAEAISDAPNIPEMEAPSPGEMIGQEPPADVEDFMPEEAGGTTAPRPRWKTWKEKIQGFIRKLFA